MLTRRTAFLLSTVFSLCLAQIGMCQSSPGVQMFSTNENGVDLATGNINIDNIQMRYKAGKISFWSRLEGTSGMLVNANGAWQAMELGFQQYFTPATGISFSVNISHSQNCVYGGKTYTIDFLNTPVVTDSTGATHSFGFSTQWVIGDGPAGSGCTNSGNGGPVPAADGSGYSLVVTNGNPTVYYPDGKYVTGTCSSGIGGCEMKQQITDPDGATVTFNTSSNTITDSLGTTVLTISSSGSPPSVSYSYLDANGNNQTYVVNTSTLDVETNFHCINANGVEAPVDSNPLPEYLVTSIALPTGAQYKFTYEPTPGKSGYYTGRIAEITLPSGGTISYAYSGGNYGINCTYETVPKLTVTVNDNNGNVDTYTYVSSLSTAPTTSTLPYQAAEFTVTKTDPAGNQTVYTFDGEFQTEKQVYQGSAAGTPLLTTITCYNGANSSQAGCISPGSGSFKLPITQTDVYTSYNGGPWSLVETKYDNYTNVTDLKKYAFGATFPPSGTPLSEVQTAYNTGSTCGTLSTYIYDLPCTITVLDSSGNTASVTKYTYSATGHATQIQKLVSGSTYLTYSAAYNGNGTMASSTDANGGVTNYYYNGTGGCNNLLLTSTVYPVNSLTTSQTWNCNGGVETTSTDASGQVSNYGYVNQSGTADPLWRLLSEKDPLGNVTWTTYSPGSTLPMTQESSLTFNNNGSTTDVLTTFNGLAQPILEQTRQAPGSTQFDTVVTTYDALNRPYTVGVPCVSTASVTCSSPVTTTTYDALSRPLAVTDGGGGVSTHTYSQNDVLVAVTPAPSGENPKQRQLEYDPLGRLTSVCEITSAAGSGTCGQTSSKTGYWTKYTYNGLSLITGVTQNAQSSSTQTRAYVYDSMGRLTSETNPESGTKTYVYDSDPSHCGLGAYSSGGDLLSTTDAAGNCVMSFYDALHRVTDVGNSNQSVSHCRRFRYDNSSGYSGSTKPSGLVNTLGRLIEAATDQCIPTSDAIITDEWFSYTARGEVSDLYQLTPNSGGYYHTNATYWANGALNQLSGLSGLPTFTYGVDGEGRTKTVSAASGQNPVTATSYNAASQPTAVTFGSADSDAFTYDSNTNRMTQYQFNVDGQSAVGKLTWNANGTLGSLVITDPFDTANNQTCNYTHDDMVRIASANCGSVWSQTFSYDAFGNINKSGSVAFQPTYSAATNHMTSIPGCTPGYDLDGDVTNDCLHTYAWDVYGRPTSIDGETHTTDALGRFVEYANAYQIVYFPSGERLAFMNGQTFVRAFIPLPGKAQAIYDTTNGLFFYRHADWLGSARLGSSPQGTNTSSAAYGPFGEGYATHGGDDVAFTGLTTFQSLYNYTFREYDDTRGRWPLPDPAGLAAVNPANPQSWNRYAYVLNNPLLNIDPYGLTCVTFDDRSVGDDGDGKGCEAAGVSPGKADDGTTISSGIVNVQAQSPSDLEYAFAITFYTLPIYVEKDVPLSQNAQTTLNKIFQPLKSLSPDACGGGIFRLGGKEGHAKSNASSGGGYVIANYDTESGASVGVLVEAGYGPVAVGRETSVNVSTGQRESTNLVFAGGEYAGGFVGYTNSSSPIQIGAYATDKGSGGGVYINAVPGGGCKATNGSTTSGGS